MVKGGSHTALMGLAWLEKIKLNWQEVHLVAKEPSSLENILRKHSEVFGDELGNMKDITVKLAIKPEKLNLKARPVPYTIKPKVETELDHLEKTGVLKKVSVSDWATPIVPVLKKDETVRICGDFKVTVNPVLPLIEDLFAGLSGGQKFSKIDLCHAYLQMQADPVYQELLTIVTNKGLYRYQRLPFGITSAPALFQRAMDQILSDLNGVQCYLNDLLITGKDDEDHLRNLNTTLQRLKENGLWVKKDKCEFFQPTIEYLGHVTDSTGLHTASSKVKAIVDAPSPKKVSQLRSFLGLLTYYAKFMPNLASRLRPLHELLNKSKQWKCSDICEKAFKDVKCTLTQSKVLTHYNPSLPIQLACDASPYGVGAVLSHVMPSGVERPIAFASRTLNSITRAESNYAQIEREALAIVFGVKKFHQYLFGHRFTLLTDHLPLFSVPKQAFPHWWQTACSVGLCCCRHISMTSSTGAPSSTVTQMDCPGCLCQTHHQKAVKLTFFIFRKCRVRLSLLLK
uniref:ribonuclease H n=1 Tax=Cyprinus carpio TaxID=7962 RepID=A0A8C1M8Q9_CYPCA